MLKRFLNGLIRFFIGLPLLFCAVITGGCAAACGAVAFCTMRGQKEAQTISPPASKEKNVGAVRRAGKPKKTISKTVKSERK